ncbi:hypothetical protein [uncultured Delftia sp.]|jgi:hypothetical protein|uniref:hypothetical protein n=1 Tax=uncultured Delftia sp. TaxID=191464 RepID=UPI000AE69B75|nr:hypothetical protein [uncultured Delftia sp.]
MLIRIDAVWRVTTPLDMRAGTEIALARLVQVIGSAKPHHAYLFANRRTIMSLTSRRRSSTATTLTCTFVVTC